MRLASAAIALALAGCAASVNENPLMIEVPTPDALGSKIFQYENDGPEAVALHAKTGVLCIVPAHAACSVHIEHGAYVVSKHRY